jgi:hypothetical protein
MLLLRDGGRENGLKSYLIGSGVLLVGIRGRYI